MPQSYLPNEPYFPYHARVYKVGGCVRDELLGLEPRDIDYVVENMTHEEMIDAGFDKVGQHFPVYLWGQTEYALCRRERKTGLGYDGFAFETEDVTLREDLMRRDLTINAMAKDNRGNLIDPFGGQEDLKLGILRHVSDAFAEDPIRVLRTARFSARYGFRVAPETRELMKEVAWELNDVPQERIWAEMAKGLMEPYPARMFELLQRVDALDMLAMHGYSAFDLQKLHDLPPDATLAERAMYVTMRMATVDDYYRHRIPHEVAHPCRLFHKYSKLITEYEKLTDVEKVDVATSMMPKDGANHLDLILKTILRFDRSKDTCASIAMLVEDQHTIRRLPYESFMSSLPKGTDIRRAILEFRMEAIRREK